MKTYFYGLLEKYIRLFVRSEDSLIFCSHPSYNLLSKRFPQSTKWEGDIPDDSTTADYIVIDGRIHYEHDIQTLLEKTYTHCQTETRLIITFYSVLWRPLLRLATWLQWRTKTPEQNWLTPEDMANLLTLSGFELVKLNCKILCPISIPFASDFLNRFVVPLPLFKKMAMVNILIARPLIQSPIDATVKPSVSVVIPARNEAGNIENAVLRLPVMGPEDELIFVEGNSTDNTWDMIQNVHKKYGSSHNIIIAQQPGKGKGDAVRKGFSLATNDILMILDADLTVPPEDLPKFYHAITTGKGEFINGSRLVYPMEGKAMRFFNMVGNKFFAYAFSFVLGQNLKDTLCGTKVLSRSHYNKLTRHRKYFGEFDPFGDFDLLLGASKLNCKIVDLPVRYRKRTYGEIKIHRWKHGWQLMRMLTVAFVKLKLSS